MSGETVDSLRKRAQNEATCLALNDLLKEVQAERDQLRAENKRLRAHKNDYMEAAEETRKALDAALAAAAGVRTNE